MEISSAAREQIAAEAIEWFLRVQASHSQAKDLSSLSEWLTRSPVHIEEYLALSATWGHLAVPNVGEFETGALIAAARESESSTSSTGEPTNVYQLKAQVIADPPLTQRAPQHKSYWMALAASIVLCVGVWIGFDQWHQPSDIATAVGEQRSITLSDGSVVILNTDSRVRVRWTDTERRIELIKGEGQFYVAKNPERPFLVSTATATVRAIGTVFNVRSHQSGTQVAVLEGRVKVDALKSARSTAQSATTPATPGAGFELDAGQRAAVTVRGIEPDVGPSVESVAAWTQRRLVFRDQRLDDVVTEFNRYRVQPLVIDDAELKGLRMSGVFDLSDPESLLSYLEKFETVEAEQRGDALHLSRDIKKLRR